VRKERKRRKIIEERKAESDVHNAGKNRLI
jgi:hypothetical protein